MIRRARSGGMPEFVPAMHAALGAFPTGQGWAIEPGWEGLRCIAYVRPGHLRLLTVRDQPVAGMFPELRALTAAAPRRGMVLDGTIVALDDAGVPRGRLVHRRIGVSRPGATLLAEVPAGFVVGDLLWLDGASTMGLPYSRRRTLIEELGLAREPVVPPPSWPAGDAGNVLHSARRSGMDGVYAKRLDAPYRPGRCTRSWLRVPVRRVQRVVVGGWNPADPRRPASVAALLLGLPDRDGLHYVGRVGLGSGPDHRAIAALLPGLRAGASPFTEPLPDSVARDAVWAVPRLVGRVEFGEWTADGRLRLPVWLGLGDDAETDPGPPAAPEKPPAARGGSAAVPPSGPAAAAAATRPQPPSGPPVEQTRSRRLEQHFVYNALSTIAALVRTDPGRARELLLGFADLTRAADQPADAPIPLDTELSSVQAYLDLEQARFGRRLRVAVSVAPALLQVPVSPMSVLTVVRDSVQQGIEPRPEGGSLVVTVGADGTDCVVTVLDETTGQRQEQRIGAVPR
ncbi:histidine kinase [Pseudonocardia hispaniensis]|uniref:DNA ligase (ATP) n=1 Tax=Pseudonocardia hispaniensis TaxID=904933 RepID=A0ABW1J5F0_9PSEU